MTTEETIALTKQTFVDKVISLLLNMLCRLVITFLPRSKRLLLQSPSAVILESPKIICLQFRRLMFDPWIEKTPWRRESLPTLEFLPGVFHGQRSLVGYSPWSLRVGHDFHYPHCLYQKFTILSCFISNFPGGRASGKKVTAYPQRG